MAYYNEFCEQINKGIEHVKASVAAGNAINCGYFERVEVCALNEANNAFVFLKQLPIEAQFKLCQAVAAAYYYVFGSHEANEGSELGHALRLYEQLGNVALHLIALGSCHNINVLQNFVPYGSF